MSTRDDRQLRGISARNQKDSALNVRGASTHCLLAAQMDATLFSRIGGDFGVYEAIGWQIPPFCL